MPSQALIRVASLSRETTTSTTVEYSGDAPHHEVSSVHTPRNRYTDLRETLLNESKKNISITNTTHETYESRKSSAVI